MIINNFMNPKSNQIACQRTDSGKGSYILLLYLKSLTQIQVGKLGVFYFKRGYYAYVGSAMGPGGLSARLSHHLKVVARPHWHIDYMRREAAVKEVWVSHRSDCLEHVWAEKLMHMKTASIPAPGFGSSDCSCAAHLFYFQKRPELGKTGVLSTNRIKRFDPRTTKCPHGD